ncbi:MAG: sigma-70 family RNA polymerase sigma factor [Sphingomonadaceae bacterium]
MRAAPMLVPHRISRRATDPDVLVQQNMTLVRRIAWHVHGRVSSGIDVEDLKQIGMVALIEAARSYEDRGHAFSTYATLRIRGAMIDALRKGATQCRSAMAKRRAIEAARATLEKAHGCRPVDAEVAKAMGVDLATYQADAEAARAVRYESLDDMYSDHSMWFADVSERADDAIDREQLCQTLSTAIAALPEREALVLQLYFVEEMNLDEIGAVLNVGAARVCQIKKAGLDKLRVRIAAVDRS